SCYVGSGIRQQYLNAGTVLVFGAEAAIEVRTPTVNAFLNAGLNHAQLSIADLTRRPPNSPTLVAGGGIAFSILPDKLTASVRAHFVSGRLDSTLLTAVSPALRLEGSL